MPNQTTSKRKPRRSRASHNGLRTQPVESGYDQAGRTLESSPLWKKWLALRALRGASLDQLIETLMQNGFSKTSATEMVMEVTSHALFCIGQEIAHTNAKLTSLLEAFGEQYNQSSPGVPRIQSLTSEEFYEQYYFANRPVIIRGLMESWKALELWTPDYFAREFGDCLIEVTAERSSDPLYDSNFQHHRQQIRMRDYVRMIQEGGESNDYYLVARNHLLRQVDFSSLFTYFECAVGYLEPARVREGAKLWFGPRGTVTPLHHDALNNLFGQIFGRKQIKLLSPFDTVNVYNERLCYSAVDLAHIDYERFPRMRNVTILDVTLEPGEFLFIPLGWWHWVKSLDTSISISFDNFAVSGAPVMWRFPV